VGEAWPPAGADEVLWGALSGRWLDPFANSSRPFVRPHSHYAAANC
jgi:hypothetical protein